MNTMEIDIDKIPSVVLRQLIEEVRQEDPEYQPKMYDRVHNRHNRGNGGDTRRPWPVPEPEPEEDQDGG